MNIELLVGLAVAGCIVLLVIAGLLFKAIHNKLALPYVKKEHLLSAAELLFFKALTQAVDHHAVIFTKVRVADVLLPKKSKNTSKWQIAFNQISAKHFDFVLCHPSSFVPLLAIELDDSSHQGKGASKRDAIKDFAAKSAGFVLLRVQAKGSYSVKDLKALLATHIADGTGQRRSKAKTVNSTAAYELPSCPKCNADMVPRERKNGNSANNKFWGCSQFPGCRGVRPATA